MTFELFTSLDGLQYYANTSSLEYLINRISHSVLCKVRYPFWLPLFKVLLHLLDKTATHLFLLGTEYWSYLILFFSFL